jgi:putative two-component system response regulator
VDARNPGLARALRNHAGMAAKRILVVDDHQDSLELVREVLSETFDVVLAHGGAEGLRSLEQEHFDGLMLDLTMPDVDGFDVMQFVTKNLPKLPVMLTSALPNVERIAKQLGARDWVTKPYRVQLLPQKLRLLTADDTAKR